jgi:hypothetical protein
MRPFVRTSPSYPSGLLLEALTWALKRTAGKAVTCMIAYRKAKAAEDLYNHLLRWSDPDLAAHGLDRGRLAQLISQRLS